MDLLVSDKPPARTRVVVAMSGGVDSSTVAALLKEQGYDVVGITLQLYDYSRAGRRAGEYPRALNDAPLPGRPGGKTCCAGRDILDARRVADALEIPHYVLDYESSFRA